MIACTIFKCANFDKTLNRSSQVSWQLLLLKPFDVVLSSSRPTMEWKTCGLTIYSLIILCVPLPPIPYTLVITAIGTSMSCASAMFSLLYLRSLPLMHFTCAQPFIMAIAVLVSLMAIREFFIITISTCFHAQVQELLEWHPLLVCGLANNRPSSVVSLLVLIFFAISKIVLLVDPMTFHAYDHEKVSASCFSGIAVYFAVDVVLYLVLGNIHYCHPPTLRGYARMHSLNLEFNLGKHSPSNKNCPLIEISIRKKELGLAVNDYSNFVRFFHV